MPRFSDMTRETSSTTGTANFVLTGAASGGFQTFVSGFGSLPIGNVAYGAKDTAGNWEIGRGTFNGSTGLTRDVIRSSSAGGTTKASFGAGLQVYCTPSAEHINNANIGLIYAAARCAGLQ